MKHFTCFTPRFLSQHYRHFGPQIIILGPSCSPQQGQQFALAPTHEMPVKTIKAQLTDTAKSSKGRSVPSWALQLNAKENPSILMDKILKCDFILSDCVKRHKIHQTNQVRPCKWRQYYQEDTTTRKIILLASLV